MNKQKIGITIKDARIKIGLNQTELANILKVRPSTISNWESGRVLPSVEKIQTISSVLGITFELGGKEETPFKRKKIIEVEKPLSLGECLKIARKVSSITQKELADEIGVTQGAIGSWERGETEPSLDKIKALCNFFDISACEFIGLVHYQEDSNLYELIKMYTLLNKDGQRKLYSEAEDLLELGKYKK